MAKKHHPVWVPGATDLQVAAALGGSAAFLPLDQGWAFVRSEVRGPRSPVLDLVQAVYERWPERAHAVLRHRIRATVLSSFDRDVVKVAAKRVSLVPVVGSAEVEGLVDLGVSRIVGVSPALGGVVATLYD